MQQLIEKAKQIRAVIFDVDGVLTSGDILYGAEGPEYKFFNVQDGLGIKLLQQANIATVIITAKQSACVALRVKDLGIPHYYYGCEDKLPAYEEVKALLKLEDTNIAFIGDDLPDLALLRRAGLAATVPHATAIIQQHSDWVSTAPAGKGAVREFCELILNAQNLYTSVINSYLTR